jgi:hypothetical protein
MSSTQPSPLASEEIARDATWLAQALDPSAGTVRLVAMDRDSYRAASFLDDRLMQQPINAQIVPWPDVQAAVADDLRQDARWIFHVGHVGSTLVSRLLGEIDGVLAVREPRILRDLAVSPPEVRRRYIAPVQKLMSRTFADDEMACVKATSFASEVAAELVPPGARALFMYARPKNYVGSILAGENSVKELRMLESYRAERLARREMTLPPARNDAERAAAAWACEMTTLEAAADAMADRQIAWADFDSILQDPVAQLITIKDFFGFKAETDRLDSIARGPLMQRYSKDLSYEYTPRLREELIAQELRLQRNEIDAALAMLRAASEKSPLLVRSLSRSEGY